MMRSLISGATFCLPGFDKIGVTLKTFHAL
ncbi:hypothetical protein MNBD_NITROSPINAE03-490, partial [hydrothermal vent metagenome]